MGVRNELVAVGFFQEVFYFRDRPLAAGLLMYAHHSLEMGRDDSNVVSYYDDGKLRVPS